MMTTLKGKIAYIAGGTGNVGEGIVRAFLKHGATVITSSRKQESLQQLRELLKDTDTEKLITMTADLGELASAEQLRDEILSKCDRLNYSC